MTHAPGGNALEVVELTIAMALLLIRQLMPTARTTKEGVWNEGRRMARSCRGNPLGIIGVGRIDSLVATCALAFDMGVMAYDRHTPPSNSPRRVFQWLPFDSLRESADLLTLRVPLELSTAT